MKYLFIQQVSEENYGVACLAMIAKFYGKNYTITKLRELVGTGQKGTTLLGLRRGSKTLGFNIFFDQNHLNGSLAGGLDDFDFSCRSYQSLCFNRYR